MFYLQKALNLCPYVYLGVEGRDYQFLSAVSSASQHRQIPFLLEVTHHLLVK